MIHSPTALQLPTEGLQPGSITELALHGAWVYSPRIHSDQRGSFHEWFRAEEFTQKLGYPFPVAQGNLSHSMQRVVRGIHLAELPPGQAKYVMCVSGSVQDILVDLRLGSPTFGQHISLELSQDNGWGVYIPSGIGHGFAVTSTKATITYLVTEAYNPQREFAVNPYDPTLALGWTIPREEAILSDKDHNAPSLEEITPRLSRVEQFRAHEQQNSQDWQDALDEADSWQVGE